jgi:hypothetical protein
VTYRRLHNAIDDMNITATGQVWCHRQRVDHGQPGRTNTVWGDTDCDGRNDGWISIDTSKEGWALYDDNGNYVGQRGWVKPKRDYKALELQVDRAWDGGGASMRPTRWPMGAATQGSGQLRYRLRRCRAHRELRQPLGQLRWLRLPGQRPATSSSSVAATR